MSNMDTLHAEANAIKAQIATLQADLAVRTAALAAGVAHMPGKYSTTAGSFTVSENNTYDESVIQANLKPGQVTRCEVRKFDKTVAKRLYPAAYLAAKKNNGVKVTL